MRERSLIITEPEISGSLGVYIRGVLNTTLVTVCPSTHTAVMHDVVTDEFGKKSSLGHIINNSMDQTELHYTGAPYDVEYTGGPDYYETGTKCINFSNYLAHDIDIDNIKSRMITRSWANVTSSESCALVTIAEGKKSVVGIYDIIKRLRKVMKAVKRLQFQVLKKELKIPEIMNRWLEIRYGVRPLIYDAKQIVGALSHEFMVKGSRRTFRSHESESSTDADVVADGWYVAGHFSYELNRNVTSTVQVRAGVLCQLERLLNTEVWGLLAVPEAILDLTTFSFVVGWFFNVADVVAAWTPSANWKALSSWVVVKESTVQRIQIGARTALTSPYTISVSGGYNQVETIKYNRIAGTSRFSFPSFNVRLDAYKLIDLVALSKIFWGSIPRLRI